MKSILAFTKRSCRKRQLRAVPASADAWSRQTAVGEKLLLEKCFRGWPESDSREYCRRRCAKCLSRVPQA